MELVYLWVEEYKNIRKQGFNFSPRFRCEYDEKKKELKITDKEETGESYPKNFFGENINITAIVGENGSGKSIITYDVFNSFNSSGFLQKEGKIDASFMIFEDNNNFLFFRDKKLNSKINSSIKFIEMHHGSSNDLIFYYFASESIKSSKNRDGEPFSKDNFNGGIPVNNDVMINKKNQRIDDFNYKFAHVLEYDNNFFKFIDKDLNFDLVNFQIEYYKLGFYLQSGKEDKELGKLLEETIGEHLFSLLEKRESTLYKFFALMLIYQSKIYQLKIYQPLLSETDFLSEYKNYFIERGKYKELKKEDYIQILKNIDLDEKKKEKFSLENIDFILENFNYDGKNEIWKYREDIKIENFLSEVDNILKNDLLLFLYLEDYLKINFKSSKKNNIDFLSLSSGEQNYIKTLTDISFNIKKSDKNNMVLLLDEPDTTLHPRWQKKIFYDLLNCKENIDKTKNIHLIITTHSPFILSDIPKENVIFLEKDEKTGNCINVSEKMKDFNTFGANIHTLLSHGFFMKNGLMGEFAKSKIESIKDFYEECKDLKIEAENYNNKKNEYLSKKNEFRYIQSIIGEPFIKNIMKNYLDELDILFIGKNKFIDEEINRLEAMKD